MIGDNFRLVAVGGLADAIDQIAAIKAWDELIATAPDEPHFEGGLSIFRDRQRYCDCYLCRPSRLYR